MRDHVTSEERLRPHRPRWLSRGYDHDPRHFRFRRESDGDPSGIEGPFSSPPVPLWIRLLVYLAIAAALLAAVVEVRAAEPWEPTDRALAAVAVTALVVDWGQTREVSRHPELWREKNPILGEHPSIAKVNTYFIGYIAGTLLLADWLSPPWRRVLLGYVATVEVFTIGKNYGLGVRINL